MNLIIQKNELNQTLNFLLIYKKLFRLTKRMQIKFSRHAKRRSQLYDIPRETIENILNNKNLSNGKHEIVENMLGFKYPLKIVCSVCKDPIVVITNYPYKKGKK